MAASLFNNVGLLNLGYKETIEVDDTCFIIYNSSIKKATNYHESVVSTSGNENLMSV